MDEQRLQAVVDRSEINNLLINWGQARDRGEWDLLRDCYHPDGTMHIAWISDSGEEFVRRSAGMLANEKERGFSKHFIGPGRIQLNDRRAFSQCHVNLITRVAFDGIEFDWEFWGQFYDWLEKRDDDQWRIFKRTMVYEKDRLDPVDPTKLPAGYYEAMNLDDHPHQVRYLYWRTAKDGRTPVEDMVLVKTPEAAKLLDDSMAWLSVGA